MRNGKKNGLGRLLLGCLPLMACTAVADTIPHDDEISVLVGYIEPDDKRSSEYGSNVRATYGLRLNEYWWIEPNFSFGVIETDDTRFTDNYQQTLGVDLTYRFFGNADFSPFAIIGGGASRNDVARNQAREFGGYGNVGLGLLSSELADSGLRLRAEARYLYDTFDDGRQDFHIAAGITVPIGGTRTKVVERIEYVEKPVIVEKEVLVGPSDSDGDGVVDGVDKCPDTVAGLEVDGAGCVKTDEAQNVVLKGVTFEVNSDRLTANAKEILATTAEGLKGQGNLKVEIAGHTDSVGSAEYNQALSKKRAESVRDYLLNLGVAPDQLTARGYGESRPLRSNETPAGRERNRRVEINVVSE